MAAWLLYANRRKNVQMYKARDHEQRERRYLSIRNIPQVLIELIDTRKPEE